MKAMKGMKKAVMKAPKVMKKAVADAAVEQIKDGMVRWNRRRAKKQLSAGGATLYVYAGGLLKTIRSLREELLANNS